MSSNGGHAEMRLVANKVVATAWNDLRLVVDNIDRQKKVLVMSLGSKFIRDSRIFRQLFPRNEYRLV
jgi:hypothetical protein